MYSYIWDSLYKSDVRIYAAETLESYTLFKLEKRLYHTRYWSHNGSRSTAVNPLLKPKITFLKVWSWHLKASLYSKIAYSRCAPMFEKCCFHSNGQEKYVKDVIDLFVPKNCLPKHTGPFVVTSFTIIFYLLLWRRHSPYIGAHWDSRVSNLSK